MVFNILAEVLGNRIKSNQARSDAKYGDKLSDENATVAHRRNTRAAAVAHKRDRSNMKHQNRFNSKQAQRAREWDRSTLKMQRRWQKGDQASQFVDVRAAAEAAGFNPLSVLGSGMTPVSLQGTTSAAAYGATAPASSVPMTYGQPVYVAPLASNDAIMGTVEELGRQLTGTEAVQKANEKATIELAQIEQERKQAGLEKPIVAPSQGAPGVADLRPPVRPVSSMRVSDNVVQGGGVYGPTGPNYNDGFAPTYHKEPTNLSPFGAETRPETVATGMSQVANEYLPWSNQRPYDFWAEPDEIESWIVNAPFLAGQIVGRGINKIRQPFWERHQDYTIEELNQMGDAYYRRTQTASPQRTFVPSLTMGVPGPYGPSEANRRY